MNLRSRIVDGILEYGDEYDFDSERDRAESHATLAALEVIEWVDDWENLPDLTEEQVRYVASRLRGVLLRLGE